MNLILIINNIFKKRSNNTYSLITHCSTNEKASSSPFSFRSSVQHYLRSSSSQPDPFSEDLIQYARHLGLDLGIKDSSNDCVPDSVKSETSVDSSNIISSSHPKSSVP